MATFVGGSWDDSEFILRLNMRYTFDRVINRNPIEFHLFTRLEANFKGDSQVFERVTVLEIAMIACRCYPQLCLSAIRKGNDRVTTV